MKTDASPLRFGSRLLRFGFLFLFVLVWVPTATPAEETTKLDCGVNSLFVLLNLEGRSATLRQIEAALPARNPEGYSMGELAAAASQLGLNTEGIRCEKTDRAPERPAIFYLKDAKGGHFAVVRPVGVTGTMVQVIDPPYVPWIADYEQVAARKSWMGRALVVRNGWPARSKVALVAGVAIVFLIAALSRGRRTKASLTSVS